jgi:NAD(P)-dependent dehydrogenase (short-subunit alcohol dehydrogenase family)
MTHHPAFSEGNVAVITGGADGIGLASAHHFLSLGMQVCIADIDDGRLASAVSQLGDVLAVPTDVSNRADIEQLRERAYQRFGRVDVLMNNAGTASHCGSWSEYDAWRSVIDTNLWGVINGVHAFTPSMIEQGSPGLIINTGSKQGITTPPGNPAYNVSKAGVKAVTEALQVAAQVASSTRILGSFPRAETEGTSGDR